jgi:ADP-heptose:LPS heptosyltransferase
MKGRTQHSWNYSVRQKMLNVNYLEFTHLLAGVPENFEAFFYPSEYEKKWAKAEKAKYGKVIMWALAGSSVHKLYPHLDTVIARILSHTDYKIVLVGNDKCRILEQGWEEEPRVIRKSGEWSIRKTMAFSLECDLVIGPETGIMNCVGLEDVPMIIFLSHSSEENLTKHFKNCIPLTPENCDCYPCHLMHYGWDNCKKSEKEPGVSECAYNISPDKTWNAICEVMKWRSVLPMTNYTQHKK